jgi:D-3-phosphoglycerate dehydrogenase
MPRILLTHSEAMFRGYYGDVALAALHSVGTVVRNPQADRPLATPELIELARGCQIIVSDRQTPGEAALFRASSDLVAFVRCAVDIRNVDVAAASEAGVLVTRASPGFVPAVGEWILGAMIALARKLPDAVAGYRAGRQPAAEMGIQLTGATAGVIGYGAIGRHVVTLLNALGMRVLVTDPHTTVPPSAGAEQVDLPALLSRADFVICLAVATEETENLIDAAALARMRPTAFLINASRGNLVDEAALRAALTERRIAGAALDVGRAPDQMPSPDLARLPNVVATPHIGGLTPEAVQHQAMETTRQVAAIARGEAPTGAVNADAAERLARLRN